ncbi:hypothetical protein FPV67DRAFT_1448580 [Lyophyllum atratum]|nr:hypothetical protein FPV67DRAFT_1448580 [Lyophyllum atratum]
MVLNDILMVHEEIRRRVFASGKDVLSEALWPVQTWWYHRRRHNHVGTSSRTRSTANLERRGSKAIYISWTWRKLIMNCHQRVDARRTGYGPTLNSLLQSRVAPTQKDRNQTEPRPEKTGLPVAVAGQRPSVAVAVPQISMCCMTGRNRSQPVATRPLAATKQPVTVLAANGTHLA